MFGYIKPDIPNLKIREYDKYRAFYCGVCRSMSKYTGKCSGCALSYDFVFLAMIRTVLTHDTVEIKRSRCSVNPFKKTDIVCSTKSLKYCAYAAVILTEYKLKDDIKDERGKKRLRARVASFFLTRSYRRARREYPTLDKLVESSIDKLSRCERQDAHSLEKCSDISGELLSDIFSHGLEGTSCAIAASIGRSFGKWIYIMDAADDYLDDIKASRFNPIVEIYSDICDAEKLSENLKITLINILADAEPAFDLIEYGDSFNETDIRSIIDNIIYAGMLSESDCVLNKFRDSIKSIEHERK